MQDIGFGEGKGYSLNFPLRAGIDDANFVAIFEPVSPVSPFDLGDPRRDGTLSAGSNCVTVRRGLALRRPSRLLQSLFKGPRAVREVRAVVRTADAGAGGRRIYGAERIAMLDVRNGDRAGEGGQERTAVHGLSGVFRAGLLAADHAEVGEKGGDDA